MRANTSPPHHPAQTTHTQTEKKKTGGNWILLSTEENGAVAHPKSVYRLDDSRIGFPATENRGGEESTTVAKRENVN